MADFTLVSRTLLDATGFGFHCFEIFRTVFGPNRVGISAEGFNDLGWLGAGPESVHNAS